MSLSSPGTEALASLAPRHPHRQMGRRETPCSGSAPHRTGTGVPETYAGIAAPRALRNQSPRASPLINGSVKLRDMHLNPAYAVPSVVTPNIRRPGRMDKLSSNGAVDRFPLSNPAAKVGYGPAPGGTHTPDECRSAKLVGKFWLRESRLSVALGTSTRRSRGGEANVRHRCIM
ncbi:uncharacterized protein BXZ73DRAFT_76460 [Epithele typhae]|uniref:uncharacterized protein n=1 Tax=Epithele typhae TaxID=378194 RepID=UPI002007E503|nr:uncharacterized protein BXZ73DRAFT_76460 [Epithele typhae]KAH9937823.1 hypothetical protein BXZ73DRAFT_76460 [Epithele typhae]